MTRRSFIAGAALAMRAAAKTREIRKAIMYATIRIDAPVHAKFAAVREAGFAGIEPMSHMSQSEMLDALAATGLNAASVCCSTHWKQLAIRTQTGTARMLTDKIC